jgi:hypothetical protein
LASTRPGGAASETIARFVTRARELVGHQRRVEVLHRPEADRDDRAV